MTTPPALLAAPSSTLGDAFADTVRKHRQTVRLFIACHALSKRMLAAVEREVWRTAAGLTGSAAPAELRGRLLDHAVGIIARQLEALVRQELSERDSLLHGLAQTSLESLHQRSAFNEQLGQQIQARHRTLDPGSRELLKARYQEHALTSAIASARGWNQARVDEQLLFARAAVDWSDPIAPAALSGRGLPTLIETYLAGSIDARSRIQLAKLLLGDLAVKAQFERQVRLDLVLSDMVQEASEPQLRRFLAELAEPAQPPTAPLPSPPVVSALNAASVTFGSRIPAPAPASPRHDPAPVPAATPSTPTEAAGDSVPQPPAPTKPETRRLGKPGTQTFKRQGEVRRRMGPPLLLLAGAGVLLVLVVAGLVHALRPAAATPVRTRGAADQPAALAQAERIPAPNLAPSRSAAPPVARETPSPSAHVADAAPPPAAGHAAGVSDAAAPPDDMPRPRDLTVWVAGDPARANGWSWPKEPLTSAPAVAAAVRHQGRSALRMHTEGGKIAIWGWNWLGWFPPAGTDISSMKDLLVAVRIEGADKPTSVRLGLDCATRKYTKEYELMPHYAGLTDGGWHEVSVPLAEIVDGSEFDPHKAWELRLIVEAAALVKADIYVDDIGFAR
jgi:hypothetical protein